MPDLGDFDNFLSEDSSRDAAVREERSLQEGEVRKIQGDFFNWDPPKSVRLHSKSHQKSSKCQNLLTEKNLDF